MPKDILLAAYDDTITKKLMQHIDFSFSSSKMRLLPYEMRVPIQLISNIKLKKRI